MGFVVKTYLIALILFGVFIMGCTSPPEASQINATNKTIANSTIKPNGSISPTALNATTQKLPCDKMQNGSVARDNCHLTTSIARMDPKGCGKIIRDVLSDSCYYNIANSTNNMSLCIKIYAPDTRDFCFRAFNETGIAIGNCMKKSNSGSCLFDASNSTNNSYFCEWILDRASRDECQSNIALRQMNATKCDKITDPYLKDQCAYSISLTTKQASICEKMSAKFADLCYLNIAKSNADASQCGEVLANNSNNCYLEVAKITKDPAVCAKISPQGIIWDECYNYLVQTKFSVDYCLKINSTDSKIKCVTDFARGDKNSSNCDLIVNMSMDSRDVCVYNIALAIKNATKCYAIYSDKIRDTCFSNLLLAGIRVG